MDILAKEAKIFTKYLIGRDISSQALQTYKDALVGSKPNNVDQKLLQFMVNHPGSIGFIDAGLVFHSPSSEARRRLYVMLAILEASTDHHDLFLPKNRSPFYIFVIVFSGVRAIFKAIFGVILVKVLV